MLFVFGLIGFLLGLLVGALVFRGSSETEKEHIKEQLDETQKNHEAYQEEVKQHFYRSAELFRELNQNYKDIHDHLVGSADKLCGDAIDMSNRLESTPTDETVLEHETPGANQATLTDEPSAEAQQPAKEKPNETVTDKLTQKPAKDEASAEEPSSADMAQAEQKAAEPTAPEDTEKKEKETSL